jgi:ATP-dependent RNA helicase SUPV3L1/SUV3
VRVLQWRNDALDFRSISALKASLDEPPGVEGLTKAPPADDQVALETLARDGEIADRARGSAQVERLWEVCRVPDYRKIAPAQHAHLVGEIFGFIADGGVLPDEWIAGQVRYATRRTGDIDTLSSRIAHIRPGPTSPTSPTGWPTLLPGEKKPKPWKTRFPTRYTSASPNVL